MDAAKAFALSLGKTVVTSKDSPGFVTSERWPSSGTRPSGCCTRASRCERTSIPLYKLGFHHPMGPLELLDLVGLDTALAILDVLWGRLP